MVEVGSVSIKGTINTSDIERGFARMELSLGSVKGKAEGFTADLDRMDTITRRLSMGLIGVGIAGATGMIALAKDAPAVAGSMAEIEVSTQRLSRALGVELAPAFAVITSLYSEFVTAVESKGLISTILESDLIEINRLADLYKEAFGRFFEEPEFGEVGGGGGPTGNAGARPGDEGFTGTIGGGFGGSDGGLESETKSKVISFFAEALGFLLGSTAIKDWILNQ